MSDRACYIRRTDRGARITQVRLLAERADESWNAGPASDAASAEAGAVEAADWTRDRLGETRSAKRLDTVCLDVDGAVCSWVKGRDADADLIRSAVEGADHSAPEDDALDAAPAPGVADRLPRLPLEVSYDILADPDAEHRVGVIAAPDAPARLFLDRLDGLGVRVGRVITLWHALAEAWDPGARAGATDSAHIVATEHPPAAILAIDHNDGRLVWSWSQNGVLLACGSVRIRKNRPEARNEARRDEAGQAEVFEHDLARLAGDWLGWSAQIGVSPARIVVVGQAGVGGMSNAEIAQSLTHAWPGAVTDLVGCDDPVAETLRRTLDARPINSFSPLADRPTRAHRGAYRWFAGALLVGAGCAAVLAARFFARAGDARAQADALRAERTEVLTSVDPSLVMDPLPIRALEGRVAAIERRTGALRHENPRPILDELDTLSLVLGAPGVTLDELDIGDGFVTVKTRLEDIRAGEQLDQALHAISDSGLRWQDPSFSVRNGRLEAIYMARWLEQKEDEGQP